MSTMDTLISPFESWQDGLLELADALGNAERIEVMVARLEATAQITNITLNGICALALLTGSSARFDPSSLPTIAPHPAAVAFAEKLSKGGELDRHLTAIADSIEHDREKRKEAIHSAFP